MDLRDALSQISEIRQQMARAEVFRGCRAMTTAFSGAVAAAAAVAQALWAPDPPKQMDAYLGVWLAAAVVSLLVVAAEMTVRYRRSSTALQKQITWLAVDQFVPSLVAGGLLTFVVARFASASLWMLPGLWAIVFGLGVFASRRFLPRRIALVGGFYLLAGLLCLTLDHPTALSPWTMALTFGVGQLLAAAVLYWTLERGYGRE